MSEYRRMSNAAWESRRRYLIRSLFYESPDLSTIQEESDTNGFGAAASPLICPSPRASHTHRYSPPSPLPPLTIEIVKKQNKHDEPEEFYKRLRKKMLKIYKRIFIEDRSDISDIYTSDDDDTPTDDEPIDYSFNRVELVASTPTNRDPIDLSTSSVELVESTHQSEKNVAADQENNENVTAASTENEQSTEEIEVQSNESSDDDNSNESDDENHNEGEDDNGNDLEANMETNENKILIETNIFNDEERVSSSTDVIAPSTESSGDHDSVIPLSSTVELSRDTSDEEVQLERNEVPATATHQLAPKPAEMEEIKTSGPLPLTVSFPRAKATPPEETVNIADVATESENRTEEIENNGTPGPNEGSPSKDMEDNASMDTENSNKEIENNGTPEPHEGSPSKDMEDTENSNEEIENNGTPEPHEASPSKDIEDNASMDTENSNKEIENNGTPEPHEGSPSKDMEDNAAMDTENSNEEIENNGTPEPHEGSPSKDIKDNASLDRDTSPENNSPQNQIEEMRTPRLHHSTGSPTLRHIHPYEPNIVIIEHHAAMESETNSIEDEMPSRPNNIDNPENLDLFDLITISSPKEINIEDGNRDNNADNNPDKTRITNPEEFRRNITPDSGDIQVIYDTPDSGQISPSENNRKRKGSPCRCNDKRVRVEDKSVQTNYPYKYIYKYKYRYRYYLQI